MSDTVSLDEFTKLQMQYVEYKTQALELQDNNNRYKAAMALKEKELKNALDAVAKSKKAAEVHDLILSIDQLKQENKTQQDALRENVRSMFEANDALQQEVNDLKNAAKLREAGSDSADEIADLKAQIESLQKSEKRHLEEITNLQLAALQARSEAHAHPKTSEPEMTTFDPAIIEAELDKMESDDKNSKDSLMKAFQIIWDRSSSTSPSTDDASQVDGTKVAELELKIKELEDQLSSKSDMYEHQLEVWKEKTKLKQNAIARLDQDHHDQLEKINAEHESILRQRNQSIEVMEASLKQKIEDLSKAEADVRRFKEELDVVQQDRGAIIDALMQKDLTIDGMKDKIAVATEGHEKASKELEQVQMTLTKEKEKNEKILKDKNDQISKLNSECEKLKSGLTDAHEQSQTLKNSQKRVADLEHSLEVKENFIKAIKESEVMYKKNLETAERNLTQEKQASEKMRIEIDNLQQQIEKHTSNLKRVEGDYQGMLSNHAAAKKRGDEISDLQKETQAALDQLQEKFENLQDEKEILEKKLKTENAKISKNLKLREEEVAALLEDNTSLEQSRDQLSVQVEELVKFRQDFEESSKKQIQELSESNEKFQVEIQRLQDENSSLSTQISDVKLEMQIEIKKQERKVKDLQDSITKERKALDKQMRSQSMLSPVRKPSENSPRPAERHVTSLQVPQLEFNLEDSDSGKNPSPGETPPETPRASSSYVREVTDASLQEEINTLAKIMGELQADKWHLEENNRHLEETIALMKSDAEKKRSNYPTTRFRICTSRISFNTTDGSNES
eukprot:TRINITY_DN5395_c0_g1_i3.p1 TRINITY_DN5395_c0_g1~~TRINITY_DN5395_c0_g1_i3.p1  ORF type:complete len:795 (-),score=377.44 TRINITY_DN5395_c0_g1_i3:259-2643(-)